MQISS